MKKAVLAGASAVAMAIGAALAGGWATTHSMEGGAVALTNEQANAVWTPVAVLWAFGEAASGTVTVSRVSQGGTYVLGASEVSNATSAVWVPEAAYPFGTGDVLRLESTVTNGRVQVIRKGG